MLLALFMGYAVRADNLWFLDTFTVSAGSIDVNFEYNAAGRQSGGLAPLTYTEADAGQWWDFASQVGNSANSNALLLTAADFNPGTQGRVSPDFNLKATGTNRIGLQVITFTNGAAWEAINFGANSAGRNQFVNAGNAGFGILFQNDGLFQAFHNSAAIGSGAYTDTNAVPGRTNSIVIEVYDTSDGDPWNGVGSTMIDCYADGGIVPFFSYTNSPGYTNNYITVQGFGSYNNGFVDDLAFSADEAPPVVAPTPVITQVSPDGSVLQQRSSTLAFTVTNSIAINSSDIEITLNGSNVWSDLNFTGDNTTVLAASMPLEPDTAYALVLTAYSTNGLTSDSMELGFDTFSTNYFTWEAEDWNYSTNGGASGGLFIDNPPFNAYRNFESAFGIDATPVDWPNGPYVYRTNDWIATAVCGDIALPAFVAAAATNSTITNYNVDYWGAQCWQQYTRTFPSGTYYVYGRMATDEVANKLVDLIEVDEFNSPVQTYGSFVPPGSGTSGWQTYEWLPLVNTNSGLKVPVTFAGEKTLRVENTSTNGIGTSGINLNLFMLVPTNAVVVIEDFSLSISESGGDVMVSFPSQSEVDYTVYFKTNLTDASWTLKTNFTGTGGTAVITEPAAGTSRYYRVGAN